MTNGAAWSREHVAPKLDAPRELDSPVKDPATVPVATTRAGRGLIVHSTDEEARIFALEPDPEHPYDAGDTITTTPKATPNKSAKKKSPDKSTTTTGRK